MDRRSLWFVTLPAVLLAVAGPILLTLFLVRREALADESARARVLARALLVQAERSVARPDDATAARAAIEAALQSARAIAPQHGFALLAGPERRVLASHGEFRPAWLDAPGAHGEASVDDGELLVALASRGGLTAVVAAPRAAADRRVARLAYAVVPAALLAGLVLVLAVQHETRRRLAMPAVLRGALRRGEFFLAFQPLVDLATRRWIGAEALIRWQRGSGEVVPPQLFLAAAEDAGLIQALTRRVFELVAKDAAGLFERHPGFHLALNLSAADLYDETTVTQLRALAERLHAQPGNLVIEANERGFANPRLAGLIVDKLCGAGMRVAIDDFGTGQAGLAQLQRFRVDFLKIDRSFVDTIGTDAATSDVVEHIIRIAQAVRLELIAEGVETEAQARYLHEHGVRYAQGWLFARPLALAELRERLARQAAGSPA